MGTSRFLAVSFALCPRGVVGGVFANVAVIALKVNWDD